MLVFCSLIGTSRLLIHKLITQIIKRTWRQTFSMQLREISLQTKNVSAVYNFYASVLGLPVFEDSKRMTVTAGSTTLHFDAAIDSEPYYHFAFNIPSTKIEEAARWLLGKVELLWIDEYQSEIAEFTTWNARSVYFFDAAGNIVEFIARADLNDHPAEAFSAAQIRSASEIGLVFPAEQFEEKVNELMQRFQLKYFSKQPPMKHFRALGDDEGVFIVVPEKRNWYPTNIAGGIFPGSRKQQEECNSCIDDQQLHADLIAAKHGF